MKIKIIANVTLLLAFAILLPQDIKSQNNCGTDHYNMKLSEFEKEYFKKEDIFNSTAPSNSTSINFRNNDTFYIPVVFHILHNNGPENISKAQVLDAIRILNEDFNRQNADTSSTRGIFKNVAANCQIVFRLATIDPWGNCTEGIVRKETPLCINADNTAKNVSVWPTDKYYNIWFVRSINSYSAGGGIILGYAQFPWAGSYRTDGVIIRHDMIGGIGTAANPGTGEPYKGRTLTHETGHWLGLYHTFQDSCNDGDKVMDTPPTRVPNHGVCLPSTLNSCNNDIPDLPDQYENYMDYSSGSCQNMFTLGQKARMIHSIQTIRFILVSEKNLINTGIKSGNSKVCKPFAEFTSSTAQICEDNSINFIDLSYNYTGTLDYDWLFEGGNPEISNLKNPIIQYDSPGYYNVRLIVSNNAGSDTIEKIQFVSILPKLTLSNYSLFEQFESNRDLPLGWSSTSNTLNYWKQTNLSSYSGKGSIMIENGRSQAGNTYYLYSPQCVVGSTNPTLSFYYSFMPNPSTNGVTNDLLRVSYSINCGVTWQALWVRSGATLQTVLGPSSIPGFEYYPPSETFWQLASVSLGNISTINRNNVIFRFEFTSNGGNNIFIDNINVGWPMNVNGVEAYDPNASLFYPNPSEGIFLLNHELIPQNTDYLHIEITDLSGRKVWENPYFQPNKNLDLSELEMGIYLITTKINGRMNCSKVYIIK